MPFSRRGSRRAAVVLAVAVAALTAPSCGSPPDTGAAATLDPWQPLAPGIRLRRGHARGAFGLDGVDRPQDLTAVEIDLATPGLAFVTNPAGGPDAPARPGHQINTTGGALSDLVSARPDILVAVNANFFWPCCPLAGTTGVGMTVFGLAATDGAVVADPSALQHVEGCPPVPAVPDAGSVGAPALVIDGANRASFVLATAADPVPAGVRAAVAGGPQPEARAPAPCGPADGYPPGRPVPGPPFLRRGGEDRTTPAERPPEYLAARSFAGLSADGRRLVLATVDGSERGGAAFADEAGWLALLGAADGLNLDGGGSSALVLRTDGLAAAVPSRPCPGDGPVVLLNVPDNGGPCRERLIGTYLGVVAPR